MNEPLTKVHKAYRFELKPNRQQLTSLREHAGAARYAYNWALNRCCNGESKPNAIKLHKEWNSWKRENAPWVTRVSKCAPQSAFKNLQRAYQNFFEGRARFPKARKKHRRDSFRLDGALYALGKAVQLPRLGRIRVKENTSKLIRRINEEKARIVSATVTQEADRWFVSFAVEEQIVIPESCSKKPVCGIDLGLSSFVTMVDEDGKVDNFFSPKALKKIERKRKRLQKAHSRKKKGSNNRKKSAKRIARICRKEKNRRRDFLHKLSSRLAKTKRAIGMENLSVKNMLKNHRLAKSISDAGWRTFREMLEYKCKWYGCELVIADRFYPSSKLCSNCGTTKPELSLSERVFRCAACGYTVNRDENAAINLRQLCTASSTGNYACGDSAAGDEPPGLSRHGSLKQEVSSENSMIFHRN